MLKKLIITDDGSHSIAIPEMNVSYHSRYGAIQESRHIFIEAGLKQMIHDHASLSILEVGFGTGLNALLTLIYAERYDRNIYYEAIETDPLDMHTVASLNYTTCLYHSDLHTDMESLNVAALQTQFLQMHRLPWDHAENISANFRLHKKKTDIRDVDLTSTFNLVYFDAFDPVAQPELWTRNVFSKIYATMMEDGLLLTYCSKSRVQKVMREAGFSIEKLAGPPGKREIVRAVKK